MIIRWSKIFLVAAAFFYCLLTVFGNITDYSTNFKAVETTLLMKYIFPDSTIAYRAITTPMFQHAIYCFIVSMEAITGLLCAIGALMLFKSRHQEANEFNKAKNWAIAGLTLGFLSWQVIFMSIGGEWFGIWMSPQLNNALNAAFQIFATFLGILIFLVLKDE